MPSVPPDLSATAPIRAREEPVRTAENLPVGHVVARRFRVEEQLGSGGMGVVYRAHDTRLGRDVAIKLVRDENPTSRARFLREAMAMARLQHSNVVTVHDAGESDEGVFIAMELVAGHTLRHWLRERPRGWREVRDAFLAAGEGLAALHRAGLVHRDFKPSNVLVAGGRVSVADLGLARAVGASGDVDASSPCSPSASSSPHHAPSLTHGAVVGTPGYMPPEQLAGGDVDARADQYAFCVALGDALPPDAPSRLRAVVARGKSARAADRHPSMEALLAALRVDPGRRLRRAAFGALLAVAGAAAVLGVLRLADVPPQCEGESFVAPVWNDAARARLRGAFLATGLPHALESYVHTVQLLDGQAAALATARAGACRALRASDQSAELVDLRVACLARRRAGLEGLVTALAAADAATLNRAVQAAGELPGAASCDDAQVLLGAPPLPGDPAARARVAALEARVATAQGLVLAGKSRQALELAPALVADARALGYAPTEARALEIEAEAQHVLLRYGPASEAWRAVLAAAARAHDDLLGIRALSRLVWALGSSGERLEAAGGLVPAVEAALVRAGDPAAARGEWLRTYGDLLIAQGQYVEARARLLVVVHLRDRDGAPGWQRGAAWNSLAVALRRSGQDAWAEQALRLTRRLYDRAYGPTHPMSGGVLINLGGLLDDRGQSAEAEALLRRALEVLIAGAGPENPQVAMAWNNLSGPLRHQGRNAEALDALDRALRIKLAALGPDNPSVAASLAGRAELLLDLGRPADALGDATRAAAIIDGKLPPEHPRRREVHELLERAERSNR